MRVLKFKIFCQIENGSRVVVSIIPVNLSVFGSETVRKFLTTAFDIEGFLVQSFKERQEKLTDAIQISNYKAK